MPSPRPRDRGHNDHDERDDDDNHGEGSSQGTTRSQRAKLPPPRSHHPPIQQCSSVSSYERLNRIEEGSYGIVYRARHLATGQVVALKKLKMQNERSGFPITSLREIRTLMMASHHPNVVRLQEVAVGDTLTQVYLVFEFVEHDLKTLLVDMGPGLFSLSEIKSLLRQLLSGLAHLHAQWIIHRDLKTSNLLLDNRGTLKIADFGLARLYGDGPPRRVDDEGGGAGNKDGDTGSASPGALTDLVVTLWYRSPELLLGETDYDTAIDVWSVGCIMAELLKGEPLFQGRNESDQILKIFQTLGPPTPASWPKANSLPLAKGILSSFARSPLSSSLTGRSSRSLLASHLPPKYAAETHGSACLDVLLGLLCCDPSQRLTADEATHHPWFASEPPRPAHPESFGTWPSRAAGETRRKVTLPEDARAKSPPAPRAGPQRQQRGGTADDEDGGGSGSGSGSSSVPRKRGAGTDSPQRKKYQLDFGF